VRSRLPMKSPRRFMGADRRRRKRHLGL
jgi:hypothetical protein